ncbi:hypothetical protein niasHS_003745 [Heterodera schachtii]|uniref:Uncharacterized protein n=1 Tax=Heterodera schachtii TaxID=97005 RepID=A0ABD2KHD5_HETSC
MASKYSESASNSIEQSPSWEKSREAIRRPIKKRKSKRCLANELEIPSAAVRPLALLPPMDWDDSAARSPFDCASDQIGHCESADISATNLPTLSSFDNTISNLYPVDFSHFNANSTDKLKVSGATPNANNKPNLKISSIRPPRDWRLGTRLRLISEQPFPWLSGRQITTTGNYPVKLPEIVSNSHWVDQQSVRHKIAPMASLHCALLFHQFPSIGAVQLFPRRSVTGQNALLKSANFQSIEANFMDILGTQWAQSLLSLFRALSSSPASLCSSSNNSFYLCAPQFTALFAAVPSPTNHLVALVTPTTSGFRQILQTKSIEFTLPFKTTEFVELGREDCPKDFLTNIGDESIGMDHDEWLRDLGISPRSKFKLKQSPSELDVSSASLLSNESNNDSSGLTNCKSSEDNSRGLSAVSSVESSKSAVLIRGAKNVEAFCRLLIGQPTLCSTKTGPQAGLPPTLISNVPFRHNTLKELSVTSQVLKKQGKLKYALELDNGPVMPSTVERLLNFVRTNCARPNRLQIHVVGRAQCNGINEALNAAVNGCDGETEFSGTNFAELEWQLNDQLDGEQLFGWN